MSEQINEAVRQHEETVAWEYRETARTLHPWADRFNTAFFQGEMIHVYGHLGHGDSAPPFGCIAKFDPKCKRAAVRHNV